MASPTGTLAFSLGQLARFAWFYGQYRAAARRVDPLPLPDELRERMPGQGPVLRALFELMRRDRANIAAGRYPLPSEGAFDPVRLLADARRFMSDLPRVDARRHSARGALEVRDSVPASYPAYYRQNFHFQSDGYLSAESAALYDYQVETLFSGGADAMRRQALVPLAAALAGRDLRSARVLDLAAGTGRMTRAIKDRWPRLSVDLLDLSPHYLARARRALRDRSWLRTICANAEAIPAADASYDAVACVFTFHELPPRVRGNVAREIARVLRPGGRLVFIDSLQRGDVPAFDPLLEFFPHAYHEPFYASYLDEDLAALFAEAGLVTRGVEPVFLSRLMWADRAPGPR